MSDYNEEAYENALKVRKMPLKPLSTSASFGRTI